MTFLYPEFLWALSLIAIPIAIHLFNFRRYKKVYFSDISLLKSITTQTKNRSQLKNILILISRIIAICCIVLAFSYPFNPEKDKKYQNQKVVAFYVDNSLSMENKNKDGYLLDLAKQQALDICNQYPTNTRYVFLTNDLQSNFQRDLSKAEVLQLIEAVQPSYIQKNFAEIYLRVSELLKDFNQTKDLYWLTDLQESSSSLNELKIDSTIQIQLLPYLNENVGNLFIDSVWFDSPNRRINKQEFLTARIINSSENSLSYNIEASVNKKETRGINNSTIDPKSDQEVQIPFMVRSTGIKHLHVKISDYSDPNLLFDDSYYLTYNISDKFNILHLYNKSNATTESNHFNSLFSTQPTVNFNSFPIESLDYSLIGNQSVIILENINAINSGLAASLNEFVSNGNTLIVFPGSSSNLDSYNVLYNKYGIAFNNKDTTAKKIASLNYEHPVFNGVFKEIKDNINLPIVRTNFNISINSVSTSTTLMKMSNNTPFLIETIDNMGAVYTFSTSSDEASTNFLKHALFVPTILRITELSQKQNKLAYTIGLDNAVKSTINISNIGDLKISKVDQQNSFIPGYKKTQLNSLFIIDQQINQPGPYNIHYDNILKEGFSFNFSRDESNTTFLSIEDFKENISNSSFVNHLTIHQEINNNKALNLSEQTKGILYWKHFILLTLLFLGLEILLIRLI